MKRVLELDDTEAAWLGALLADHPDASPRLRAWARRLLDQDEALLAATVEKWRRERLPMTIDGAGACFYALRELGLDVSESTARRAWQRHYKA